MNADTRKLIMALRRCAKMFVALLERILDGKEID